MVTLRSAMELTDRFTPAMNKIVSAVSKAEANFDRLKSSASGLNANSTDAMASGLGKTSTAAEKAANGMDDFIRVATVTPKFSGETLNSNLEQTSVAAEKASKGMSEFDRSANVFPKPIGDKISDSLNKTRKTAATASDAMAEFTESASVSPKMNTAGMNNALDATLSKTNRARDGLGDLAKSAGSTPKFNMGQTINSWLTSIDEHLTKTGGLLKTMLGAQLIGNGITAGLGAIKNSLVGFGSDLSEASATWQTFQGNMANLNMPQAQINSTKKDLQAFAQQTIYSASDMASTYSQLAAVGTKNTTQLVKGFGGLAAASTDPAQAMTTLSQQATQMAAKPKVAWEDFKLILEQTPAGVSAVAKTMGMSTSTMIKNVQDGKIATQDFFNAIAKTGTNANFTAMATQYKTVGQAADGLKETLVSKLLPSFGIVNTAAVNMLSKVVDAVGEMDFSGVGRMAVGVLNGISTAIDFVTKHADGLKTVAVALTAFFAVFEGLSVVAAGLVALQKGIVVLKVASSVAGDVNLLKFALANMAGESKLAAIASAALNAVMGMNPFILIAAAIAAVSAGLVFFFAKTKTGQKIWSQFVNWLDRAAPAITNLGKNIQQLMSNGLSKLAPTFSTVGSAINKLGVYLLTSASAIGMFASAGISKLAAIFSELSSTIRPLISSGLSKVGPLLDSMGGAFGKLGVLIGPVVSLLTKVGLAAIGITGPWGIAISVITAFLGMWAKTGQLNASGITQVFSGLSSAIATGSNLITKYLPQFVTVGTSLLVSVIDGIALAIPKIVSIATTVITSLTSAMTAALPEILSAGTQVLLLLVQAITAALPIIATAAVTIITGLANALIIALPAIISAGTQIILMLVQAVVVALPILINVGIQILTALVQGVTSLLPMLIGAGLQIVMSLFNALIAALPTIISAGVQILMALVSGIVQILPQLVMAALQIIMALTTALITALPQIIAAGISILEALISGIVMIMPQLVGAALSIVSALFNGLIANLPRIIDAGVRLLGALINGIVSVLPQIISAAVRIVVALFGAIIQNAPKLLSAGVSLIRALISGIGSMVSGVVSIIRWVIGRAISAARSLGSSLVSVGRNLISGLVQGISSMVGSAVKAVTSVASKVVDAAKSFLHIHSPSRVFRSIGGYVTQGLALGITSAQSLAVKAINKVSGSVVDAASGLQMPTIQPANSPGDMLAAGFARAAGAVGLIGSALTALPASSTVGVVGQAMVPKQMPTGDVDNLDVPNGVGDGGDHPDPSGGDAPSSAPVGVTGGGNSYATTTSTSHVDNSVSIAPGAIVINGGNPDDAETIVAKIEAYLMQRQAAQL